MKILVRATNWIGDAVMSLPALRALRARYPEAEISILAKPWVADLYQGWRIIPFERFRWSLIRQLRAERFDLAVLFPNSFSSALVAWLAGAKRIVGYDRDARGLLIPFPIELPPPAHERYYYLELLKRARIIEAVPEVTEIRFDGVEEARARGEALFRAAGIALPVTGVSPGAAFGSAKRWLPERFAEVARRLGGSVAVFGSAAEKGLCEEVARLAGGKSFAGATSLRQFIDMVAACRVFLCNDSGAMHIAYAAGVPSVTVFGPTNEFATGPTGSSAVIVREPVECAPCGLRECPIDHRCMTRVTVDHVMASIRV
ncbi:MAG TPA: lipopolysaccharide heptosyltransferase II [Bryobacteraceae bacterium]|nr:lipopolysaccharide heptosyltransferase II [Bryobacteraceae bacterium]